MVGRVACQRRIQVGEAAYLHPFHTVHWLAYCRLAASLPRHRVASLGATLRQITLQCAHVAHHQQDVLLLCHPRQPLADRIASA